MKHGVLATVVRKLSPTLIPNVGVRVAAMHTQLEEEEAQEHTTRSSITKCAMKKMSFP